MFKHYNLCCYEYNEIYKQIQPTYVSDSNWFKIVLFLLEKHDHVLPTLLHFAAYHGLNELVATLIDLKGAAVACNLQNCDGLNPIVLAKRNGHTELAGVLEEFQQTVSISMFGKQMISFDHTLVHTSPSS